MGHILEPTSEHVTSAASTDNIHQSIFKKKNQYRYLSGSSRQVLGADAVTRTNTTA